MQWRMQLGAKVGWSEGVDTAVVGNFVAFVCSREMTAYIVNGYTAKILTVQRGQ